MQTSANMQTSAKKFAAAHNRAVELAHRCGGPVPPTAVIETRSFAETDRCSCVYACEEISSQAGLVYCNWCGGVIALSPVIKIGDLPPVPRW